MMSRQQQQIRTFASSVLPVILGSLLLAAPPFAAAQNDGSNGPPNVLVIQREFLKPGKAGSTHETTERAFVNAMTAAHSTSYYFAMDSMSGPSRSLFFQAYPSFEAWEKDTQTVRKDATLTAAIDHASLMDGEMLTSYDQGVFAMRPDLSLRNGNLKGMRYMEIMRFDIKPGHEKEWEDLVKMYVDGFGKAVPEAHWTTFQMMYGSSEGGVFLALIPLKSLRETDASIGNSRKFGESMAPEAMKRLSELTAASVKSSMVNLYEFNPRISYPRPEWIADEPDFWKPAPPQKSKGK